MRYCNRIKTVLRGALLLIAGGAALTSCTDWLEKDPEAIVAEDEAFKNYRNFQGYIEEIYSLIPDKEKINYCTAWNFGDDAVHNTEGYAHMDHQVDLGNYRNWYTNTQCWLKGGEYIMAIHNLRLRQAACSISSARIKSAFSEMPAAARRFF